MTWIMSPGETQSDASQRPSESLCVYIFQVTHTTLQETHRIVSMCENEKIYPMVVQSKVQMTRLASRQTLNSTNYVKRKHNLDDFNSCHDWVWKVVWISKSEVVYRDFTVLPIVEQATCSSPHGRAQSKLCSESVWKGRSLCLDLLEMMRGCSHWRGTTPSN